MRTLHPAFFRALTSAALVTVCGAALGLGGCSRDARGPNASADSETGMIGVALNVAPGISLTTANYTITGPNGYSASSSVNVANSDKLGFTGSGLPAGSGYTIVVTASGSAKACSGTAGFAVAARMTTNVAIQMSCKEPPHTGGVTFNGALNVCPRLGGLSVMPAQAAVGQGLAVGADWSDTDGGPMPLSFHWAASSGTFTNPSSATTSFFCSAPGTVTLSFTVSDGDPAPGCAATGSVQVTCLDPLVAQCSGRPEGTACNDGNACTQGDHCHAGVCTAGTPVTCAALDQCHAAGVCDPSSGVCSNPNKANGVACNDQNACTQSDSCQSGACVGASPVTCTALDQCHTAGTCNPTSGVCSNPSKANGSSCNDGNLCSSGDTCQAGTCTGTAVTCTAGADACHPGVCDPASGACSNANVCAFYGVGSLSPTASDGVVGNALLEDGTPDNQVGALGSAISYTGSGNKYIVTPDRGPNAGLDSYDERYYLVDLSLAGGVVTPSISGGATLNKSAGVTFNGLGSLFDATNSPSGSRRFDSEGVRVTPAGTFWVSDEYGPFLYEFSATGDRLRFITLPSKFAISNPAAGDNELPPVNTSGRVVNRGMEGLAISPDGHRLYGLMQNGIIQDGELDSANKRVGTHNRLIEFDADTGVPLREFLYVLDNKDYGCNELLAVNDHQFLAIERDGNGGTAAAFKKLMLIDITGATDISGMSALSPNTGSVPGVTPVSKQVFLDLLSPAFGLAGANFPEKIEGLAFGPDQPDGRHVLVVTNDNDFITSNPNNFYVFFIGQTALPGFQQQQATFSNLCANVTCPAPADACHLQGACNPGTGLCSTPPAAAGTPVGTQTAGDCQKLQCDGAGHVVSAADNTDVPNDNNACTSDSCSNGSPVFSAAPINTPCAQGGGSFCDGAGACVACNAAAQCPGSDDECKVRTCSAHACGVAFAPAGQPLSSQTAGDCHQVQCDGAGNSAPVIDNGDVPVDGNACTSDVCTSGTPSNPPTAAGSACSGGTCNGAGSCTGCLAATDCPGADTACSFRTCTAGACGVGFAPAGTATSTQTPGDCQKNVCDGSGNVSVANDDTDPPTASGQCQAASCSAGTPVTTPKAYGADCSENGGQICDGASVCIPQYLQILRVDGTSSAASPLTLVKFTTSGVASPSSTVALASTGTNAITQSGSASSEGGIALSSSQKFLAVGGYNAAAGTASVASTATSATNRACVLLNASMAVTSTSKFTTAFSGNNVRGVAAADDGSGCWANGNGSGSGVNAGGVWWVPANQTGGEVHLTPTAANNSRWLGAFSGQLYGSSGSGTAIAVYPVGTGMPTTAGQTANVLSGTATSGTGNPSPYGFVFFDRDSTVAGVDTMYLADDRAVTGGGGIQKWTFNGTTWTLVGTFSAVSSGTATGYRGLTGTLLNGQPTLVGTTTEATANRVVVFVDTGSGSPTGTVIATSPSTANYRGVVLQPHN